MERKEAVALAQRIALLWVHLHAAAHEYWQVPAHPLAATGADTADYWCTLYSTPLKQRWQSSRPLIALAAAQCVLWISVVVLVLALSK